MLFEKGCRWKIGDGRFINVWTDAWLHDQGYLKVTTPMDDEYCFLTVSDLFISGTHNWNVSLLRTFFNERDVIAISSIPCRAGNCNDTLVWNPSRSGVYTVKSGYMVATTSLVSNDHLCVEGSWTKLWDCRVPCKVRAFLWRAVRNCLPNRSNLIRRTLQVPCRCVLCDDDIEDNWLLFVVCSYARSCWAEASLDGLDSLIAVATRFENLVWLVFNSLSTEAAGKCAMVCWTIWRQRNMKFWQNCVVAPRQAVTAAWHVLYDWLHVRPFRAALMVPRDSRDVGSCAR